MQEAIKRDLTRRNIKIFSTTWCPDCHRAKAFLQSRGVSYSEIDIEKQPEAAEIVAAHNDGRHVVPTFEIDGRYFGNPPISELKKLLISH